MMRVESGTRGDEWCVWTMVREETNRACVQWYERRRIMRVDNGMRGDESCVWTMVRVETNVQEDERSERQVILLDK
jgi:hypothetical protein